MRNPVKIKSIKIDQAEGVVSKLISGEFKTFDEAGTALRRIQYQCEPDMLGYLKTDVEIMWEDGSKHNFRADVNHHGDDTNLTEMLLSWAARNMVGAVGRNLKHLLPPAQVKAWEEHAARLLNGELVVV
jgi:hypothetical protein